MNLKQIGLVLISCGVIYFAGYLSGSSAIETEYQEKIIEQLMKERALIQENKVKEQRWRDETRALEEEYQKKIADIEHTNGAVLDRLRKQLDEQRIKLSYSTSTSNKFNERTREAQISERIKHLAEFSERCARRADQLIIQVEGLQSWIKKTYY